MGVLTQGIDFFLPEAVGGRQEYIYVLLWLAVFENVIARAAAWRDVDALVARGTTGGGGNMQLSSVGASPWHVCLNKVNAPTCLLCARGWLAYLLREASGIAIILTARLWMAPSLPSDVSSTQVRHIPYSCK